MDNMNLFDLFSDEGFSFEEKKEVKSAPAKKEAKSKSAPAKKAVASNVTVKYPVKVIGFGYPVMDIKEIEEGKTESTLEELRDYLVKECDIYQAASSFTNFIYDAELGISVFATTGQATDNNAEIMFPVTVCFGRESEIIDEGEDDTRLSQIIEDFSSKIEGLDAKNIKAYYDIEAGVISLFPSGKVVTDKTIPEGEINVYLSNGEFKQVTGETVKELARAAFGDIKNMDVSFTAGEGNILYPQISVRGGSSLDNSAFVKHKGAKINTEKKFKLPFKVYLNNIHKEFEVSSENFPGKESVTADEIDEYAHKAYPSLVGMKRKCEVMDEGCLFMNHDIPGNRLG